MSANLEMRRAIAHEGVVERLLEIYRLHTHRYPLAEAVCEISPKKHLFEDLMQRDLLRFSARSQNLVNEEINAYEKTFCILMRPDEEDEEYRIGGTNIYIERIMKLGTGLEQYYETFDKEIEGEHLTKLGGKTTPENAALRWALPEASSYRTAIVNSLKKSQPHDFPQLRSFEALKLLETASTNGTMYTNALSRDPQLMKLWDAYKSSEHNSAKSGQDAAAGGFLTKTLAEALETSRLLDAATPCLEYLKVKNRAWLKAGMEAMMKSGVQEILAQKEEGAMMVELTRAIKCTDLTISGKIDEAKGIHAKVGGGGDNGAKGSGGGGGRGGKQVGLAVRKPRHRWLRRMGVDPEQGVHPTSSGPHGGQRVARPRLPPLQRRRQEAFHEGRQRNISAQHCGDEGGDFWTPYL